MSFAKHKVLILLCFLALPHMTLLALLETRELSSWVLNSGVRFVRLRTGLKVDAKNWQLNPLTFSARVDDVNIEHNDVSLTAQSVELWFSPVALFLGALHLNELSIRNAELLYDGDLFQEDSHEERVDESVDLKNLFAQKQLNRLGESFSDLMARLRARNISFNNLRLDNFALESQTLNINLANILVNNLDEGQFRAEWELRNFHMREKLDKIKSFSGSISLLKSRGDNYQLYLGPTHLILFDDENRLSMRGAWPGQMGLEVQLDVASTVEFMKKSDILVESVPDGESLGGISATTSLELDSSGLRRAEFEVKSQRLVYANHFLNNIHTDFVLDWGSAGVSLDMQKFEINLPRTVGVPASWKNLVAIKSFKISDNDNYEIQLSMNEASLCGIKAAAAEYDCHYMTAFDGTALVEGTWQDFSASVDLDLGFSAGFVTADPIRSIHDLDIVAHVYDGHMRSEIEVSSDKTQVHEMQFVWNEGARAKISGEIRHVPTLVDLDVEIENSFLESIVSHVAGFELAGESNVLAKVLYDHSLSRELRTRVDAEIRSGSFRFEGQDVGSIAGPIVYRQRVLGLGPFQLRSGGGSARVEGALRPDDERGQYLDLEVTANRFEMVSYLDEARSSEAFRGFVSGKGTLRGFVNSQKNPDEGIKGDLNFSARNLTAFQIDFSEANMSAEYLDGNLLIDYVRAQKESSTLNVSGFLSPQGGSEILFFANKVPLKSIEIDPKLSLFEKGNADIEGFWRPADGWSVSALIREAQIAGAPLGSGRADLGGDDKNFDLKLVFDQLLEFEYGIDYLEDDTSDLRLMRAELTDRGIYAGLAYLGSWSGVQNVETQGALSFSWGPESGFFKSRDLRIDAPHADDVQKEELLNVQGDQQLLWENGVIQENTLNWSGASYLRTQLGVRSRSLILDADLPLGLIRLFIPDVDMRSGRVSLQGELPMSPELNNLRLGGAVSSGVLRVPGLAGELDDFQASLNLQRGQLEISNGQMRAGSGRVFLQGIYRIDFNRPATDIVLDLDRAQLVVMDDVPVLASGSLILRGESPPYMLSGRINIADAMYAKEFDVETADYVDDSDEPFLSFDVDVELLGTTRIRNSMLSSDIRGNVRLLGTNVDPEVRGDIELHNAVLRANQTEFNVIQSRIQFYPGGENVPLVTLRANSSIRYAGSDYRIEMNARGPANSLRIEFNSDPPLSNQDIVSLLAFGVIRLDETLAEADEDIVSAAQAEAFQAIFGRAIGQSLSQNTGFDVRLRPSASAAARADNIPKVSVMRRISDRVTARFARSLDIGNPEKDLQVDYQLFNNVNLSGVWESPTPEETSLGVDLRFRFDIE